MQLILLERVLNGRNIGGSVPAESRRSGETKLKGDRQSSEHRVEANRAARAEIQTFLQAIASYPDCFAVNPQVTFEQHRSGLRGRSRPGSAFVSRRRIHTN